MNEAVETPVWLPPEAQGTQVARAKLTSRRILVVGAGTQPSDDANPPPGNGRAIALLCAREGALVACADKNADAAQETAAQIAASEARPCVIVADVTDEAECRRIVAEANEQLGGLDGVVVNVGVGLGKGLDGTEAQAWDQTFAVNLRAHFLISRFALPMLSAGSSIVYMSSTASLRPGTNIPAYDASKAGLGGLCRHVAMEAARKRVRANIVVPGLIDTPLGRNASKRRPSRATTPVPLGRQGTAWEVAQATVFLLSNESSYITGQTLVVDGGLSALR
jgi:NAD(P)-dependent dehydrogenase (short-subunit alcohol dehydrogenase family)